MLLTVAILLVIIYVFLGLKKPALALVTSPIICSLFVYCTVAVEELDLIFEAILLAVLIFLAPAVTILLSRREPDAQEWPQRLAKWIVISFAFLVALLAAIAVFSGLALGSRFLLFIYLLIGAIIFTGSLIGYYLTSRHATAAYVLSTIGSSMRQNLPLAMALESAAAGQTDKRSRILRRIQKWLVQGYSLSEAIKRGYPKCPGHASAMITAAERINQLPLAVKAIEADMAAKADERRKIRPVHPLYPAVLLVLISLIVWGLMTFVVPQFHMVLTEITERAMLPAPTRLLILIRRQYDLPILAAFAFIVFVILPVWLRTRLRPRRAQKPYLLSRIGDFVKWHLPILHWFEQNYAMTQTVEMLQLALNAGCTVNEAVANTLGLDVNSRFKKRLQSWLTKIERGDNIAAAAKESKLSSTLAWAFDDQVNQGNTLAILEMLQSFYRSNYSYKVNLARFIMWPCVTILMGVTVGFVVLAIFLPLIAIISHAAELVYP